MRLTDPKGSRSSQSLHGLKTKNKTAPSRSERLKVDFEVKSGQFQSKNSTWYQDHQDEDDAMMSTAIGTMFSKSKVEHSPAKSDEGFDQRKLSRDLQTDSIMSLKQPTNQPVSILKKPP